MNRLFKTFITNMSGAGKKLVHANPQTDNEWDDIYIYVSQLENYCRKFRKELTIRRDKTGADID